MLEALEISTIVLCFVALILLIGAFAWIIVIAHDNQRGSTLAVRNLYRLITPYSASKFRIFLCCYNDKTLSLAKNYKQEYSYFEPHMLKQSVYLENELIFWAQQNPEQTMGFSYVGTLACTFENKIPFYAFDRIITMANGADCIYFVPEHQRDISFIDICNGYHPDIKRIFERSCDILGWNKSLLTDPNVVGFYCNYWILKKQWWDVFVQDMCRLVAAWKKSRTMIKLLYRDAKYGAGKLDVSQMIDKFSTNYFTYHCFVLERIICLFCAHHKLLLYTPATYQAPLTKLSK